MSFTMADIDRLSTTESVQHESKGMTIDSEKFTEMLDIICENVAYEWRKLGSVLGLSKADLDQISRGLQGPRDRCWTALGLWRRRRERSRTFIQELIEALGQIRHHRMADILAKISLVDQSINEILGPHSEREAKMTEALYLVADRAAHHWRTFAPNLGLSMTDILDIQGRFKGRTREKCMHALYKWRSLVPLKEYKVTTVIKALKQSGFSELAEQLRLFAVDENPKGKSRVRNKGELRIKVQCDVLEMNTDCENKRNKSEPKKEDSEKKVKSTESKPDVSESEKNGSEREVKSTGSQTTRPRPKIPDEVMKLYAMNKLFFRFMDMLDEHAHGNVHEVVRYLHQDLKAGLTMISRPGFTLVVRVNSREDADNLWRVSRNGELSRVFSDHMVVPEVLSEIGAKKAILKAVVVDLDYHKCCAELPATHIPGMTPRVDFLQSSTRVPGRV